MAEDIKMPKKPSFLSSVTSGIMGFIKGALAGGSVGAIGGGIIAGAIALFTGTAMPALAGPAAWGAVVGALAMGSVGAIAGTMTDVVRSREAGQVAAEDVVNVAKVSFAQGVNVGHTISQAQEQSLAATEEVSTKFRDKVAKERGQPTPIPQVH